MDSFILYLLKVSAGIILLYAGYFVIFSKDTFYKRNRIFLLATMLIPFIIPLLDFTEPSQVNTSKASEIISGLATTGGLIEVAVNNGVNSFDIQSLIPWIYFSVFGFFMLRLLISIIRTLTIIRKGDVHGKSFPLIVLSHNDHPPFSFFPYIVIPEEIYKSEEGSQILNHERAHVCQGHTFDLLLSEIVVAFLWFNPFIWIIKRSVMLNHEFMADNFSIRMSRDTKEYQYYILNFQKNLLNVPVAHSFSSLIKNRIIMINKTPTRKHATMKNIVIFPLVAILFALFSFKPQAKQKDGNQNEFSYESKDAMTYVSDNIEYPPQELESRDTFNPQSNQKADGNKNDMISYELKSAILMYIRENISYPAQALETRDTATIFLFVRIGSGGSIKEVTASTDKASFKAPMFDEIVVVGYSKNYNKIVTSKEHELLKSECIRIGNKLSELNLPEWKEKNMEFVIPIKFKTNLDTLS